MTPVETRSEPSSLRLVLTLGLTGLLSGLVLVGIYLATKPRIERNQAEALQRAIFRVLPGTESTTPMVLRDGRLTEWTEPGRPPEDGTIYAGFDAQGALVGYAIPADGSGFMDTIRLIYGFDPSRKVIVGMQVLDSRETPGLGDKIVGDEAFHANFRALAVEPDIVPVKHETTAPNQVDCITGATISSEAVVSILDRSAKRWVPVVAPADGGTPPQVSEVRDGR